MAEMGNAAGASSISKNRDLDLEAEFPGLAVSAYKPTSRVDPAYNCIAFAIGDNKRFWDEVGVKGYYWPLGAGPSYTLAGWLSVFVMYGFEETTDTSLEEKFEKIAIYATSAGPRHAARQKASGQWTSKLGKGKDIEHELDALQGDMYGNVVKIMRRRIRKGRRALE